MGQGEPSRFVVDRPAGGSLTQRAKELALFPDQGNSVNKEVITARRYAVACLKKVFLFERKRNNLLV